MNKRADTSAIPIIIAIVIGVTVLIFLIFGFTTGWGTFWDRITGGGAGQANLDTIMSDCSLACTQGKTTDYCQDVRTIKFGVKADVSDGSVVKFDDVTSIRTTCEVLAKKTGKVNDQVITAINITGLNVNFNVASCPSISCVA